MRALALLVVLGVLALVPVSGVEWASYLSRVLVLLFIYIVLAQSYDLVGGHMGYVNLGHVTFFGVGGYALGILWNAGVPLLLALALATASSVAFAGVISYPFFRLRGAYFSLATFGLVQLMQYSVLNFKELTQGSYGLKVPAGERLLPMYYLTLGLVVAVVWSSRAIARSRLGLAMRSIREDEEVAADFGVPVLRTKAIALMISASFPGLLGGLFTWYILYINPEMFFGIDIALTPVAMAMLGGSGVLAGPIIGAIILRAAEETLGTMLLYLHTAMYGLVILAVGLFIPGGVVRLRPVARRLPRGNPFAGAR